MQRIFLAIDIGASSGRHIVGIEADGALQTDEVYRFPNGVHEQDGHLCWDVEALVREVLETELDSVLNAQPPCENWYQLTMRVTSFARENRRRVYHLYQSSQRDLLENEYYQVVFGAVEKLVRRTAGDLPVAEEDIQSLAALYTATLVGLLQSWLHYGMKHDEERFVERVARLTDGTMRRALERSCGEETP